MAKDSDWGSTLKQIADRMAETGVTELEVRQGDLRIRLKRKEGEPIPAATGAARPVEGPAAEAPRTEESFHRVPAPLTGVFYTASNPTARPYVEVGDWVEETTVVGLIETMKVFNEVMAECRGRVAAIVAQQGQLVQAGEPVALVDTAALPDNVGEAAS